MAARRAVPPSLWSGNERLRIGERLQASLAGIWELDLLREMQKATVERALEDSRGEGEPRSEDAGCPCEERLSQAAAIQLERSKSVDPLECPKDPPVAYSSSENIEVETRELCLSTEDGSYKGRFILPVAGEQILSPRKVGHNGGDVQETVEADSRPSSGFYETSEMGSLSDSCASVHSEGPGASRCSVSSLAQLPSLRESSFARPRSTDEAAVRLLDLQLQRLTLANTPGADNRRPVSTGDLEFVLGLGNLPVPPLKPPTSQLLRYKSDLVSRNTNEIYHYPSPLHAVALQSPLFTHSLSQSSSLEDLDEEPPQLPSTDLPKREVVCSREQQKARLDQYVAKLVLRYKCRTATSRSESGFLAGNQKSLSMTSVCSNGLAPTGQPLGSAPGWKLRRRISTCSYLRSPDGPEMARDSQILDSLGDFPLFPESTHLLSSTGNLSKAHESPVGSLPLPKNPSLILYPNQPSAAPEGRAFGWTAKAQQQAYKMEMPSSKRAWLIDTDHLYKGKHATRELVKTAEKQEKAPERTWLSPRELLRRLSLRRKPSSQVGSKARACSEMNVHAAAGLVSPGDSRAGRNKTVKPKWTSVLEISSKAPGRHRTKAGAFLPPPVLNRHLAFSSDWQPAPFCFWEDGQFDGPSRWRAELVDSGSSLGELEATSAVSLNGDWIFHQVGGRWFHGSATLDPADLPARNFKLRRSRSFKELKKIVSRSFKSSRTAKN